MLAQYNRFEQKERAIRRPPLLGYLLIQYSIIKHSLCGSWDGGFITMYLFMRTMILVIDTL